MTSWRIATPSNVRNAVSHFRTPGCNRAPAPPIDQRCRMGDWSFFIYGVPAAAGVLTFLKVVANQMQYIDGLVRIRREEVAAAARAAHADPASAGTH